MYTHISLDWDEKNMADKINRRTQVLLTEKQYLKLQELSIERKESMGYLIREAVDQVFIKTTDKKKVIDRISSLNLPVDDWEKMKEEILKGKLNLK